MNQILGHSHQREAEPAPDRPEPWRRQCFLFHQELAPEGQVFDANDVPSAIGQGWVDTPAKFNAQEDAEAEEPEAPDQPRVKRSKKR